MAAKGSSATALVVMIVVFVGMIAGQVSAAPPNDCMTDCLGSGLIQLLDILYCSGKCGVPSRNTLVAHHTVESFCKLGCISHKCVVLFSNNSDDEAVKGCFHGCGVICNSPTITTNPIKMGRNPVV